MDPQKARLELNGPLSDPDLSCHFRSHITKLSALECMAGTTGLEPATSAVTGQRSNQLSYVPKLSPLRLYLTQNQSNRCYQQIRASLSLSPVMAQSLGHPCNPATDVSLSD